MKRLFDILFALVCMAVLWPVMLLICMSIKLAGGQPIYSQERIGRGGKPFRIYKFRTMRRGAECNGKPILWTEQDERQTRIGRFLRRTHLDEMPQLWNILRGDMSFVGYRPERKYFIDKIMALRPDYAELYAMRPGLTSDATIRNGYTDTMEKMIRRLNMDLHYLRHHTIFTDMRILAQTVISVFI